METRLYTFDRDGRELLSSSLEDLGAEIKLQHRTGAANNEEHGARPRYHRSRSSHRRPTCSVYIGAVCVPNYGNSRRIKRRLDLLHSLGNC